MSETTTTEPTLEKEEKESRWARGWRYWKYVWSVVQDIIFIGLVYLAFEKMSSAFQTLVLALLILVYQSVNTSFTMLIRTLIEEAHVQRGCFLGLYKKFNDPDAPESEKLLRDVIKKYHKGDVLWYIHSISIFIVYLFVLWKVVNVLVL